MSLINEALKKAQRQRAEEQADLAAPMPGGGGPRVRRTAPALSTQTLVLLAGGGITLFVLCVVAAVLWINRPDPAKPAPFRTALSAAAESSATAAPMITLPAIAKPAASEASAVSSAAAPASLTPAPLAAQVPAESKPTAPLPAPVALALPPVRPSSPAPVVDTVPAPAPIIRAPGKFQEHIQALVDALRVSGIRASGNESKVLLNERVYKLNDIVDRTNSLRLTKVASDGLEFTTPDGVVYEKTF